MEAGVYIDSGILVKFYVKEIGSLQFASFTGQAIADIPRES